ncbi:U3 small nucleolar RNA-associated protein MPP10 [Sarotherodon galilaeus]
MSNPVLIDVTGRARLADFGISRRLLKGQTTLRTCSAGTRCLMARETLAEESVISYKSSIDIQDITSAMVFTRSPKDTTSQTAGSRTMTSLSQTTCESACEQRQRTAYLLFYEKQVASPSKQSV